MAGTLRRGAGIAAALAVVAVGGCNFDSGTGTEEGPSLTVPAAALDAAYTCFPTAEATPAGAVLLVHGTGLTPEESWHGTYAQVLPARGYDVCTVRLPNRALDDIQVSAEYVVAAIRRMRDDFGGPVAAIGHSQGGLEIRWAIRWWPDVARAVGDAILIATPNHGTVTADGVCLQWLVACTEAVQQQRPGSAFLAALNAGDETPGDVAYTSIFSSLVDAIVVNLPPGFTSALAGAANLHIQDPGLCPARPVDHIESLTDPVVFAAVLDALEHPGPADPARLPLAACVQLVAEGMTPVDVVLNAATYLPAGLAIGAAEAAAEPPLADYAR